MERAVGGLVCLMLALLAAQCSAGRALLSDPAAASFTLSPSEWPWQQPSAATTNETTLASAAAAGSADNSEPIKFPAPWETSVDNMYIIRLLPLPKAVTPYEDYAPYKQDEAWTFQKNSIGYLIIVQISQSPMGRYNEILYVPGRYQPNSCKSFTAPSVQRMFLDSQDSIDSGRLIWGYPKEFASFEWSNTSTADQWRESVVIRKKDGSLLFKANFTRTAAFPSWFAKPQTLQDFTAPQIQWPLTKAGLANPTTAVPKLIPTTFSPRPVAAVEISDLFINHREFTGVKGMPVRRNKAVPAVLYQNGGGTIPVPTLLPEEC